MKTAATVVAFAARTNIEIKLLLPSFNDCICIQFCSSLGTQAISRLRVMFCFSIQASLTHLFRRSSCISFQLVIDLSDAAAAVTV